MNFLYTFIFRGITRAVGLNIRYYYFKIIGKKVKRKMLTNEYKKLDDDYGAALKQDFYNALVGSFFTIIIILLIVKIVW